MECCVSLADLKAALPAPREGTDELFYRGQRLPSLLPPTEPLTPRLRTSIDDPLLLWSSLAVIKLYVQFREFMDGPRGSVVGGFY